MYVEIILRRRAWLVLAVCLLVAPQVFAQQRRPERTVVEIDAQAYGEGWRQTIDGAENQLYDVWIADGWLCAKRYDREGAIEWQIVLAQHVAGELPIISHFDGYEFRLSFLGGRYFVRESGELLRCVREPKTDAGFFLRTSVLDPVATSCGFGRCQRHGDWFVSNWEHDGWFFAALGPDQERFDALVRLNATARLEGGHGVAGTISGHLQSNHGDRWLLDDGDLLVAERTDKVSYDAELARRKIREHLSDAGPPEITATQWLNTSDDMSWASLQGKVVLLDFWGTWCGPCVKKLPQVQRLAEKYGEAGLVVIGIHSAQGGDECATFVKEQGLSFAIAVDRGATAEAYAIDAWPTVFVIDKTGKVVSGYQHGLPTDEVIEELLAE